LDDGSISSLILIAVLVLIHGLIAMSQAALSLSPAAYLRDLAGEGNRRANRVLALNDNLPQLQITTHLTLMFIRVTIFAVATVMVKGPLLQLPAEIQANIVPVVNYAIVLVPLTLLTYVLGDLIPSAIGRSRAALLATVVALPIRALVVVLGPLVRLLLVVDRSFSRVSGGSDVAKTVTDEEILSLVDVGQRAGEIESEEKQMIRSVLEFGEILVREIMVPRLDVVALDVDEPLEVALNTVVNSGHSRIPIYDEKIDNIKGVLYAKDLLARTHELGSRSIPGLMRPAYFVPESKRADTLFKEMQARKVHLAIVVDEYGGTAGIITIEDLIEEIVGDIQDEYDLHEEAEFVEIRPDEYIFDGSINLDDFNEMMRVDLSTDDNDTLGGYLFSVLGRVPEAGETMELEEDDCILKVRIESVEGRRIRKIHVIRVTPEPPEKEEEPANGRRRGRGRDKARDEDSDNVKVTSEAEES
jgi:CBS domain containing-hemolysin-like protein